ncbi:hypothetical protein RRG08_010913 [Elysia crispata]|uniref:Uncharacterized protein n=1 Tax=Elysia crispata TaxID=231223 RepID=A0AAE1A148_9GAST|nr:hypothetical protein RRG08_010913 [Elysia crispata]
MLWEHLAARFENSPSSSFVLAPSEPQIVFATPGYDRFNLSPLESFVIVVYRLNHGNAWSGECYSKS